MAEEKTYSEIPFTTSDQREVTIAIAGKSSRSASDFEAAAMQYDRDGTMMPGFIVTQKDPSKATMFEKVSEPLQRGARQLGNLMPDISPEDQRLLERLNPDAYMVSAMKTVPPAVASTVETPGKAATTAVLAGLSTVAPLTATSGVVPSLVKAASAGLGYATGESLMGREREEAFNTPLMQRAKSKAFLTAAAVAATDGVIGIISHAFGSSLSSKAIQQVQDDVLKDIAKKYPEVKFQGKNAVDAIAGSSKTQLDRLSDIGLQAVRKQMKGAATEFVDDISTVMPKQISKGSRDDFKNIADKYNETVTKLFDNIDDVAKRDKINIELGDVKKTMMERVKVEIDTQSPNMSQQGKMIFAAKLQAKFDDYAQREADYLAGAGVFKTLREHNPGKGFDVTKFQEAAKQRLYSGAQLERDVSLAASRGEPGGIDKTRGVGLPLPDAAKWLLNKTGVKLPRIPAGTTYTGTVRGTIPYTPINIVTNDAVRNFMMGLEGKKDR